MSKRKRDPDHHSDYSQRKWKKRKLLNHSENGNKNTNSQIDDETKINDKDPNEWKKSKLFTESQDALRFEQICTAIDHSDMGQQSTIIVNKTIAEFSMGYLIKCHNSKCLDGFILFFWKDIFHGNIKNCSMCGVSSFCQTCGIHKHWISTAKHLDPICNMCSSTICKKAREYCRICKKYVCVNCFAPYGGCYDCLGKLYARGEISKYFDENNDKNKKKLSKYYNDQKKNV